MGAVLHVRSHQRGRISCLILLVTLQLHICIYNSTNYFCQGGLFGHCWAWFFGCGWVCPSVCLGLVWLEGFGLVGWLDFFPLIFFYFAEQKYPLTDHNKLLLFVKYLQLEVCRQDVLIRALCCKSNMCSLCVFEKLKPSLSMQTSGSIERES